MNVRLILSVILLSCFFFQPVSADVIKVGLEPFPPLITEDAKGHSISLLRAIEKASDLQFEITIMPYNRAKLLLKKGKLDLIGHTPHHKETSDFYSYARDIQWSIRAITDVYGMNKEELETFTTLQSVGTPRTTSAARPSSPEITVMWRNPSTTCLMAP